MELLGGDAKQWESFNAPFGARCFLTAKDKVTKAACVWGFNAPFGARCFLTVCSGESLDTWVAGLNAPFGARCFLTNAQRVVKPRIYSVLMHLLALGAF